MKFQLLLLLLVSFVLTEQHIEQEQEALTNQEESQESVIQPKEDSEMEDLDPLKFQTMSEEEPEGEMDAVSFEEIMKLLQQNGDFDFSQFEGEEEYGDYDSDVFEDDQHEQHQGEEIEEEKENHEEEAEEPSPHQTDL